MSDDAKRTRDNGEKAPSRRQRLGARVRSLWGRGGIDENALPGANNGSHGRGTRQVRGLWHIPF